MKNERIWAWLGLALMAVSVVLMMVGLFTGAAKALLLNISLVCFLGAATVLMWLSYQRKRAAEENKDEE